MTKICKTCEHFVPGSNNYNPHCGRTRDPVLGNPVRMCETERLFGFDASVAADIAPRLDACGPDGTHWKPRAALVKKPGIFQVLRNNTLFAA